MDRDSIIREQLETWQPAVEVDNHMTQRVLSRIAANNRLRSSSLFARIIEQFTLSPMAGALASAMALAVVLLAALVWQQRQTTLALTQQREAYFALIDPTSRLDSGEADTEPSLVAMLDWMRSNFDLSREQFVELVSIHQSYDARLDALHLQLLDLKSQYDHFEEQRRQDESIDFIALYQLLELREQVLGSARSTSRQLVAQILTVLRPEQRDRFLILLDEAQIPHPPAAWSLPRWNRVPHPTQT